MPSYKSNAKDVLGKLTKRLEGVQKNVIDKATRTIAANVIASNMSRIHNDGLAVDGSLISEGTNSISAHRNNKTGKTFTKRKRTTTRIMIRTPYSESYAKKRLRKSKRIDKVNLSFSGKLSKEFSYASTGFGVIGVGFTSPYGSNLQENLEELYGKKIWGATKEDQEEADIVAWNLMNKYING